MKIHGQGSDPISTALEGVGGPSPVVGKPAAKPASASATSGVDQVTLSTEAQALLAAARADGTLAVEGASDAATVDAPAIRHDRVAAMKIALARGEVGNDPEQVAEALLSRWITKG
jgi:flagellar biosynthesis anti-sigma factor FlgM